MNNLLASFFNWDREKCVKEWTSMDDRDIE